MRYGNCAELCGEHHRQMPIVVESVPEEAFYCWLSRFDEESSSLEEDRAPTTPEERGRGE